MEVGPAVGDRVDDEFMVVELVHLRTIRVLRSPDRAAEGVGRKLLKVEVAVHLGECPSCVGERTVESLEHSLAGGVVRVRRHLGVVCRLD